MTQDMQELDETSAAAGFSAIGSEARLTVLRLLVRAGEEGLMVSALQARTGIAASTLAHHLKAMVQAGILEQERHGRSIYCRARYDRLQALAGFILSECCADAQGEADLVQTHMEAADG